MRIVYVNNEFVPENEAKISIFDRGFLFADGVYEVCAVLEGKLVDYTMHMARLKLSLAALSLACPVDEDALLSVHHELISRNNLREGMVYMQVTRGSAGDRDFAYREKTTPSLIAFTKAADILTSPYVETGVKGITLPDIRWARRDIKSIALLPQAMAKQAAREAGVSVAWMVEDGYITEESSATAYIVKDGVLITRPISNAILSGITRKAVLGLLEQGGIRLEERKFSVEELYAADEAFVTSATSFVMGVVEVDGKVIAGGTVGAVTRRLRALYVEAALAGGGKGGIQ